MAEDWKRRAEGLTFQFQSLLLNVLRILLSEEGEEGYLSRAELVKRLRDAEEELKRLMEENRFLKKPAENLDNELRRYRVQPFLYLCVTMHA